MSPPAHFSRRTFLRTVVCTTATTTVFPSFVPASALGREGAIPASERITMGFIGIGGQGGGHLLGVPGRMWPEAMRGGVMCRCWRFAMFGGNAGNAPRSR